MREQRRLWHLLHDLHQRRQKLPVLGLARRERDGAVAHEHGRDAVVDGGRHLRLPERVRVQVRVQVDEARRDDEAVRVNLLAA